MFLAAAMAVTSMVGAHKDHQKKVKAAVEDSKLQRAKLEQARSRQAGDFATNTQRAREATQKRDIAIEHSRLDAETKADQAFAGSGISGTSVDEIDNEINSEVEQNKVSNKRALDANLADQNRLATQTNADTNAAALNIGTSVEGGGFRDIATAGAQGFQQGSALENSLKDMFSSSNKPSKDLGVGNTTSINSAGPSRGVGMQISGGF